MATARRDYYDVLGVARDADAKAIKDAFRKLALQTAEAAKPTEPAEHKSVRHCGVAMKLLTSILVAVRPWPQT